jgi:hypothetical protein
MPRFEVTVTTIFSFESDCAENARYDVENGEMPRNHEVVDSYVSSVNCIGE